MKSRLCLVQEIFEGFHSRKSTFEWLVIAVFGVMLANGTYRPASVIRVMG